MTVKDEIIAESIDHYGRTNQSVVCMEECAELAQAISKELRGNHNKEHLTEEIADVYICIEMLMQMYGITENEVQEWIDKKQNRVKERMKE